MYIKKFVSIAVLVLIFSSLASANYYFDTGDHRWNNSANWIANSGLPTASIDATFNGWNGSPEVCNIASGDNVVCRDCVSANTTGFTTTLNVKETGSLTARGIVIAQFDDLTTATVNVMDNAVVNVTTTLVVGQGGTGTLRMTGGTVTASDIYVTMWFEGAVGHIQLDGGTLTATNNFWMGIEGQVSSMDIRGGTLKVPYTLGSTMENYIAAGKITAYGATGLAGFESTVSNNQYILSAVCPYNPVPENGTISLPQSVILSWTKVNPSESYDVYFGTDCNDVKNASAEFLAEDITNDGVIDFEDLKLLGDQWLIGTVPPGNNADINNDNKVNFADFSKLSSRWNKNSIFRVHQTQTTYNPGMLTKGVTYYWRIDVTENGQTYKGLVWSFSTSSGLEPDTYYVSTDGSDLAAGMIEQPFKTLEKVRDMIRTNGLAEGGVTVFLRGGKYFRSSEFDLTNLYSGADSKPITYSAYPGEEVRIIGGVQLQPSWFSYVNISSPVWGRLDDSAQGNIMQVNLSAHGITDYGVMRERGFFRHQRSHLEISFNGQLLQLARWPNSGLEDIGTAVSDTAFTYSGTRPERWTSAPDPWAFGYFQFQYADQYEAIANIDTVNKRITLGSRPVNGVGDNGTWYALNLLEELDSPGEWYLDRATGILYLWPPANISSAEIIVSTLGENSEKLVNCSNASFVNFKGITFEMCRYDAIQISGGTNVVFDNCVIRNAGAIGINILGGSNHLIQNTEIADVGDMGIYMKSGDIFALTPSNNTVQNCSIHGFGRWNRTYNPGVYMHGVGQKVRHNLMYDAPHSALIWGVCNQDNWSEYAANNNLIEFNNIFNVCQESGDAGALYTGRSWANRGNIVRYNFIHNIVSSETPYVHAIYMDDCSSGNNIFGNILYAATGEAVMCGGGRDNIIKNNIIAKCGSAFFTDRRGVAVINETASDPWNLLELLSQYNFTQPPWSTAYPALSAIPSSYSDPRYAQVKNPENGVFTQNISWSNSNYLVEGGWGGTGGLSYYAITNNIQNQNPLFIDEEHLIMALHEYSPAYTINGFQRVPWEKMGNLLQDKASRPILPTGWGSAPVSPKLYWAPALTAATHKVYLSQTPNPRTDGYKGEFAESSYVSSTLQNHTIYYWCVDEYDSDGNLLGSGDIWNFTTNY